MKFYNSPHFQGNRTSQNEIKKASGSSDVSLLKGFLLSLYFRAFISTVHVKNTEEQEPETHIFCVLNEAGISLKRALPSRKSKETPYTRTVIENKTLNDESMTIYRKQKQKRESGDGRVALFCKKAILSRGASVPLEAIHFKQLDWTEAGTLLYYVLEPAVHSAASMESVSDVHSLRRERTCSSLW